MVSSSCMTISILLAKLKNCCKNSSRKSRATQHIVQIRKPNLGSKHLSGTRFSSNIDVKTTAENCESDVYHAGLNKLVLCSDKCPNRFGEYVDK
ncbi:hypothetical protein AVEN_34742-1 [Araneus ventricosus]|uniref:Uncharacterized protein n=1 Tax=Araneus ventricosus TaxID=182803 RepID=A0A4Y2GTG2_ARAVE|nr:hypothetical protein AVEN_34742-1 [Araneus ventricosus]